MKHGIMMHCTTKNFGDDIQTYALQKLTPGADYLLDRENLDVFRPEEDEAVAAVFSGWWFWHKWNWPPAECLYPLLLGMHFNHYGVTENGSPVTTEWLEGIGGDWFRAYGPVGVRDLDSLEFLEKAGIEAYFSGCVTLTLPRQPEKPDKGTYVVICDLKPDQETVFRKWLEGSGFEIRTTTHLCNYLDHPASFEERMARVEEYLTLYQNAAFVVTSRLHCTLPCIAMEVPVITVLDMAQYRIHSRWRPYCDWVTTLSFEDVKAGNIPFDPHHVPAADPVWRTYRDSFLEKTRSFFDFVKDHEGPIGSLRRTAFSEEEARAWQYRLLRDTDDKWLYAARDLNKQRKKAEKDLKEAEKAAAKAEKDLKESKNAAAKTEAALKKAKEENLRLKARCRKLEEGGLRGAYRRLRRFAGKVIRRIFPGFRKK